MNTIQKQYRDPGNLNTRINIHAKYSVNKEAFADWIISHYDIHPADKVLELGCGTGTMWQDHLHLVQQGTLILTDFSQGMLDTAQKNLPPQSNLFFQLVDIQQIPWPDNCFEVVIANMMLYHVPDLHTALSEVRRVLKPGGRFYCATYGIHGIVEYVARLLESLNVTGSIGTSFTLQNGGQILSRYFNRVQRLDREDGLAVTKLEDFADYIYSLSGLSNISQVPRDVLLEVLAQNTKNGILYVPKEYGMFICD